MSHTREAEELYRAVRSAFERHRDKPRISPAWIATEAMVEINFAQEHHPVGYVGCHLQCRQIARQFSRKKWETEEQPEQHELFPLLQTRYPVLNRRDDSDPEYVLLECLTNEDVAFNVLRLRLEASAKLSHADALEAWGKHRDRPAA